MMINFSKRVFSLLESMSLMCWKFPRYRYILFAIATFVSILFLGYHFGTFDQSIHIPFLKKFADPSLYPNDRFLDLRFTHFSYFWFLFIPFYKLGFLEISMFITYVGIIYLTFYAIWKLTKTLFDNPVVSFLSVVAFMFPHMGFSLLVLIEFSLLNRTFVLPFLLLAIDSYLNKRYFRAYGMLGFFSNFHVLSVNFVLAMFLFDSVIRLRSIGWKKLFLSLGLFVFFALPVLIWKSKVSPLDLSIRREWFSIIDRGLLHHLFIGFTTNPKFILLSLGGFGTLIMFFIGWYYSRKTQIDSVIARFTIAGIFILIVNFIVAQWLPVTIIVESQIVRVSAFILLFGYLYFIYFLVKYYSENKTMTHRFLLLIFTTIISGSPIIPPFIWYIQKRFQSRQLLRFLTCVAFLSSVFFLFLAAKLGLWYPGIYVFAKKDADYDVQMWARMNTPKDAVFITPPTPWLFYDLEWRVISERSTVTHLGELAEAVFSPDYISYWRPRFESLAPHSLEKFRGDVFENKEMVKQAFYRLSTEELKKIAQQYGASYLVVEKPHLYNLPEVYGNTTYRVYLLTK